MGRAMSDAPPGFSASQIIGPVVCNGCGNEIKTSDRCEYCGGAVGVDEVRLHLWHVARGKDKFTKALMSKYEPVK